MSSLIPLTCSVPQWSVLGPILLISYTDDVPSVFQRHQVNYHLYADDKQAYVSVPVSDVSRARTALQHCVMMLYIIRNVSTVSDIGAPETRYCQCVLIAYGRVACTPRRVLPVVNVHRTCHGSRHLPVLTGRTENNVSCVNNCLK